MSKINFTTEHKNKLEQLFLELGFSAETLKGKFGANEFTPWELLHTTSITSLQSLNSQLKKDVAVLEEQDEWSLNPYQMDKAAKLRKWNEYVNLLVGYKKFQAQEQEEASKIKVEKEKKLALLMQLKDKAEIDALSKLTPEQLDAEIEKYK